MTTVQRRSVLCPDHPDPPVRTRDPKDDYLIALADTAHAFLVTGDDDLLNTEFGVSVLTPRALLDRLGQL